MMYYIHGFLSSPESGKGKLFRDKLDVINIKYRNCEPRDLKISNCLGSIYNEIKKEDIMPEEKSNEKCDKCGAKLAIREGRYGQFLSCSNYPKCRFIKPMSTGVKCPQKACDGDIVQKRGKGRPFYGCSNYPECKYTMRNKPVPRSCPNCQAPFLVEKWDKATESTTIVCSNDQCDYTEA